MHKNYLKLAAIMAATLGAVSCSDDVNTDKPDGDGASADGKYVISASIQGSNGTSNVLLTTDDLSDGSLTAEGHGLLNDGAYQWVFKGTDYLYSLNYNQGSAGLTRSYRLNSQGNVSVRDMEYKISRFTSYGLYDDQIITTSTGDGPASMADSHGYLPKTLLVSWINTHTETVRGNDTSTGAYTVENMLGNGEYVTLSGVQQVGDRIYTGVVQMGLSQYGAAAQGGKWVREGFQDLIATADGGSNSTAYKKGELLGTQYPDECWVAIYPDNRYLNPVLAKTDRISMPAGRFKSQYYQSVWADDKGDVYVFSPSYAKTMTDPRQQTTLPAGICRIPKGSDKFDDYYVNIEEQTGGRSFMRMWPAGGSKFLMVMYDRPLTQKGFAATRLAVFDAQTGRITDVSGLPDNVSAFGKTVYTEPGKIYVAVNFTEGYPAIYAVDTMTATAKRGVTVAATEISGFGRLK